MMRIILFLFLLVAFFTGGFQGARWLKANRLWTKEESRQLTEINFQPTQYPIENISFVIAVIGRNNGAWLEKTLQSAFFQNYPNFRVVYVDDASDEGSFELARELIFSQTSPVKTELIRNESPLGTIQSLTKAIQGCKDREIVVVLHGQDRLAHEWVLQRLNQYYANSELWMTYGQYLYDVSYQFGICRHIKNEKPRFSPFFASHLKTFYAKLFRSIREGDLFFSGQGMGAEMSMMVPMLEIAGEHVGYIQDVLYIANKQTESREQLGRVEAQIRSLPSYSPLKNLFEEAE